MIKPQPGPTNQEPVIRGKVLPLHQAPVAADSPRVLHVRVVTARGGGPDKTIFRSASYGNAASLSIAAAYIQKHQERNTTWLKQNAEAFECPLWTINEFGPADPRTVRQLLRLCREHNVSVWHGHDYKSNLYGLLIRQRWPMKLVTTAHGWTGETARTRFYQHIDHWCLKRYDHVICVSERLVEHCSQLGVASDRLSYIPNGIELDAYPLDDHAVETVRPQLGIGRDRLVIGVVGRLSCEKGVDRAIRAVAQLRPGWPNVQLHVIGDGPQRAHLIDLADELELGRLVRFWGWQDQPLRFYRAMDLLLLPSRTEGLPNTVLEAMALGVPVVATDVGGIGDLLDHGRCGVILNQDEDTWPDRVAYLLASASRRKTLARLARERIEEHYTFRHRMQQVLGVYHSVLGSRPPETGSQEPLRRAA